MTEKILEINDKRSIEDRGNDERKEATRGMLVFRAMQTLHSIMSFAPLRVSFQVSESWSRFRHLPGVTVIFSQWCENADTSNMNPVDDGTN